LLGEDEERGMDRLVEALTCVMWSNMARKKVEQQIPNALIEDLKRNEEEKKQYMEKLE